MPDRSGDGDGDVDVDGDIDDDEDDDGDDDDGDDVDGDLVGGAHEADDRALVGVLRLSVDDSQVILVMHLLMIRTCDQNLMIGLLVLNIFST